MKRFAWILLASAFLAIPLSNAGAGTVTYTGADLYNNPSVTFPSVAPTVDGTALLFPDGTGLDAAQLRLPLLTADEYSFAIDLTRTDSTGDWDPYFVLGDGTHTLGAVSVNPIPGGLGGDALSGGFAVSCQQVALSLCGSTVFTEIFLSDEVPTLGNLLVNIAFQLDDLSTTILLTFSGASSGTGSFTFNTGLDKSSLFFAILDDNDYNASYRLNSLSVTTPEVPLPAALPLFAAGLGAMGLMTRRRRKAAVAG